MRGASKPSATTNPTSSVRWRFSLALFFCLAPASLTPAALMSQGASPQVSTGKTSALQEPVDPNRKSSEFNHHMAGYGLICLALLVLGGLASPRLRFLQLIWPAFFLLAGFFLLVWSDAEIWPRGNVNWLWLLHHDQEARQHKIYALLLIAIGIVEYLHVSGRLIRFWRTWAFPILAVIGALFLLAHDHTGTAGVDSPEVRVYFVNPGLDPDGNPPSATASQPPAMAPKPGMDHSGTAGMDHSSMHGMDHSGKAMSGETAHAEGYEADHHHHHMTPAMLRVERQHFWFIVVGVGIALFRFIADADSWRRRFVPYVWPSGLLLLGAMLVLYRE